MTHLGADDFRSRLPEVVRTGLRDAGLTTVPLRALACGLIVLSAACAARAPIDAGAAPLPGPSSSDRTAPPRTVEGSSPSLAQALARLQNPTPAAYRRVAEEYRRLGIVDLAHEYLARARDLAPDDPATLDAIARLWRDSGFPHLGLADAHRAAYFAPESPIARNTLGTVLLAMGRRALARAEFERAVALDPDAAYAHNNLCYASILDGDGDRAVPSCTRALALNPALTAARNNLALAYTIAGEPEAARATLAGLPDRAAELYNAGILLLAQREYRSAAEAFAAAHAIRPTFRAAAVRARQAALLAARAERSPEPRP